MYLHVSAMRSTIYWEFLGINKILTRLDIDNLKTVLNLEDNEPNGF